MQQIKIKRKKKEEDRRVKKCLGFGVKDFSLNSVSVLTSWKSWMYLNFLFPFPQQLKWEWNDLASVKEIAEVQHLATLLVNTGYSIDNSRHFEEYFFTTSNVLILPVKWGSTLAVLVSCFKDNLAKPKDRASFFSQNDK